MSPTYSIAELSKEFSVTHRTLRFYEDKGILDPDRRGTKRFYSERDKTRLRLTLRGKRLGLNLNECLNIINMRDPAQPDDNLQLLHLCQKIREHRVQLLAKLKDIEKTLEAMSQVENNCLAQLIENASAEGV